MTAATRLAALLVFGLIGLLYLYRAPELPEADFDERSFLNIPYRFATFGDLRYPAFIAEAFGGEVVRPYPPINSFAFRSLALRLAGFSAEKSRYFSALLMLALLLAAGGWLRSRYALDRPLALVALAPAALAPVMVLAARTTRHEQETLFFGGLSALLIANGGRDGLNARPWQLATAGGFAALAAGMHPFGTVYPVLTLVALLAASGPRATLPWLGGAALGAAPTVWWFWALGKNLPTSMAAMVAAYQGREGELIAKLSRFSSVAWLKLAGLPDTITARLASVQHGAFTEHSGFPLEPGLISLLLRTFFWVEVFLVALFLVRHLRHPRVEDRGAAWLALLALGFLAFTLVYVPNTTYGLYGSFHIHLAFAASCLAREEAPAVWGSPGLRTMVVVALSAGVVSAARLVAAPRAATLDREFTAIKEMAKASGIRPDTEVMTSVETWIAAGPRNPSLFELITFGTGTRNPEALVYRRDHVEFVIGTALPRAPEVRTKVREERRTIVARAHAGLRLAGWLLLDEKRGLSVSFFRRAETGGVMVSSIDPRKNIPLQAVAYGSDAALGPRVECDQQAVPLCVFHEH